MKLTQFSFAFSISLAVFLWPVPSISQAQTAWQFSQDDFGWFGQARAGTGGSAVTLRCAKTGAPVEQYPGDPAQVSLFVTPDSHFTFLLSGSAYRQGAQTRRILDVTIQIDRRAAHLAKLKYLDPEDSFAALVPTTSAVLGEIQQGRVLSVKPQGAASSLVVPLDGSSKALAALTDFCKTPWTQAPPASDLAVVATGTGAADPAGQMAVLSLPAPFRGLSPARHDGRLLTGFPVVHGTDASSDLQNGRQYFSKPSFDLAYYLDLMIAGAQPHVFERSDVAVQFVGRYLTGAGRDRYFAGCQGSCSPNLPYDGWVGSNEFERAATYHSFVSQFVPKLRSLAPKAPADC